MGPLAAFQALMLATAAAMAVEAIKATENGRRIVFWSLFGFTAVLGIATNWIAGAWPAASAAMGWVGSSPVTLTFAFLAWVAFLQKPWRRQATATETPAFDDERIRQIVRDEIVQAPLITTGEKWPPDPPRTLPRLRLSTAEQERITDRLIKLDDYLAVELPSKLQPLIDGWFSISRAS